MLLSNPEADLAVRLIAPTSFRETPAGNLYQLATCGRKKGGKKPPTSNNPLMVAPIAHSGGQADGEKSLVVVVAGGAASGGQFNIKCASI